MGTRNIAVGPTVNDGGVIATSASVGIAGRFGEMTSAQSQANPLLAGNSAVTTVNGATTILRTGSSQSISNLLSQGGFVRINKNSHGLNIGDRVQVIGAVPKRYNVVHTITFVDTNYFITDIPHTVSTSTNGSYKVLRGTINKQQKDNFIAYIIGLRIAGITTDSLKSAAKANTGAGLPYGKGNYRINITDWSVLTGAPTYGGNKGALMQYNETKTGNTISSEAEPTRAVPGTMVYRIGSPVAVVKTYDPLT